MSFIEKLIDLILLALIIFYVSSFLLLSPEILGLNFTYGIF